MDEIGVNGTVVLTKLCLCCTCVQHLFNFFSRAVAYERGSDGGVDCDNLPRRKRDSLVFVGEGW